MMRECRPASASQARVDETDPATPGSSERRQAEKLARLTPCNPASTDAASTCAHGARIIATVCSSPASSVVSADRIADDDENVAATLTSQLVRAPARSADQLHVECISPMAWANTETGQTANDCLDSVQHAPGSRSRARTRATRERPGSSPVVVAVTMMRCPLDQTVLVDR